MLEPSKVVVSPVDQLLGFTLKSPIVTIQKGLIAEKASRVNSKLSQIHPRIGLETCTKK